MARYKVEFKAFKTGNWYTKKEKVQDANVWGLYENL
jgi:hypothetical protein